DPGAIDRRLPDGLRAITVNLTAYDAEFQIDTSFSREVQVYVQFLGTVTPAPVASPSTPLGEPLARIQMVNGKAMAQTGMLPPVSGPTTLWVDDARDAAPTYATGASQTMWFRDPFVADLQTPRDEKAPEALTDSPLENKQVSVSASRYGALGRLVVTSVFSQG